MNEQVIQDDEFDNDEKGLVCIDVNLRWLVGTDVSVLLPKGKTAQDIEDIDASGGSISITFTDGSEQEEDYIDYAAGIDTGSYFSDGADAIVASVNGEDFFRTNTSYLENCTDD